MNALQKQQPNNDTSTDIVYRFGDNPTSEVAVKESHLLANQIDCEDIKQIKSFGKNVIQISGDRYDAILEKVKSNDCTEAGNMVMDLVKMTSTKKGILGKFQDMLHIQFRRGASLKDNIDHVANKIIEAKENLDASQEDIEYIARASQQQYEELEAYEMALSEKIIEYDKIVREAESNSLEYAKAYRVLSALKARHDDIQATRTLSYQTATECLILLTSNQTLSDRMSYTVDNLVNLWKMQMVTAKNIELQSECTKLTENVKKSSEQMMISNAKNITNNVKRITKLNTDPLLDRGKLNQVTQLLDNLGKELIQKGLESNSNIEHIASHMESLPGFHDSEEEEQ